MTSEVDGLKTNEFLRRRKLRLQQVREQSKDIAKKVRQRAKVEKWRQAVEQDSKKQKEYFQRKEQLVKQLEEYCSKGLENIGASHRNASEVRTQDDHGDKVDISKQRGIEAVAELRKTRQQILDKQKQLLDRKLQARELANDISREKSASVVNKLQSKPAGKGTVDTQSKPSEHDKDSNTTHGDGKQRNIARNDMATQWDLEEMLNEWEPNIPTLALPKDDNSVKESNNNNVDSRMEKNKMLDLFALSDEMPSSLRGGLTTQEERVPVRPSMTLVSEYLQNRVLRLRESDTTRSSNKTEDLQSLKQTILRTRASKEVSAKGNVDKTSKSSTQSTVPKRNSVTIYNHTTRDTQDIPRNDERLVSRDMQADDDAYSQAMKESTCSHHVDKDKNIQDIRSKVAMTKQNVEKEYRDTISFLNALPKNKGNKPIKTAFMNEQRQQMQKDYRQQTLQQEYRKIEKECSKHNCKKKPQKKFGTPIKDKGNDFEKTDFQYSWMPVPEGDGNLAIHTIPTTVKEAKSANSVKFSKVDSYHEYRSRHKHTPPTKDTGQDTPKTYVEAIVIQTSSDDSESISSESSSENIRLEKNNKTENNTEKLSDAERIIIYKILDSKVNKRKKNSKLMKDIAKSLTLIGKQHNKDDSNEQSKQNASKQTNSHGENRVSFERLNEGVYQAVNENGDNMSSMYFNDKEGDKIEIPPKQQQFCRQCTHGKKLNREHQHEPGAPSTSQQRQSSENPSSPRSHSPCVAELKCGCKSVPSKQKDVQSTITSTSSFKTATNEDAGFVKLMSDVGQEASKFYIGASGFIKDNDYEVVIQLRKKGDCRETTNKNPERNQSQDKPSSVNKLSVVTNEASVTQIPTEEKNETSKNKVELVATVSTTKEVPPETEKSGLAHDVVVNVATEVLTNSSKQMLHNVDGSPRSTDVIINAPNTVSEKGVSTSFQDTYVVPPNVSKSDPIPRPATSTYTQTSMSSPNHRPVFFHMSSSTSTAYMSPPEMILPKFFMQDYQLTDEKYPRNYDMEEIERTENHENTDEFDCRCKKCMRSRNLKSSQHIRASKHQCKKGSVQNAKTPRNSTRSGSSEKEEHICVNKEHSRHTSAPLTEKRSICKCRKCRNHDCANNDDNLASRKKCHHLMTAKHSPRNNGMCVSSSAASYNREKPQTSNRSKTNLKPVVKKYVDQLLVLNRESLKAVQVVDQDCSSVTTPGSSIINVPNNVNELQPALENKLSLQKIKVMLRQKIIDSSEMKDHQTGDDINNQNAEVCSKKQSYNNIKAPRWSRKKTAHKVKSLNISKNLSKVKKTREMKQPPIKLGSSLSTKGECVKEKMSSIPSRNKIRSKSSPTPRLIQSSETTDKSTNSDLPQVKRKDLDEFKPKLNKAKRFNERKSDVKRIDQSSNRATSTSTDSDGNPSLLKPNNVDIPMSISTQTSINVDSEINFMKLAENKLQNMEKIADLTEKCTQRLSNLAKVLEEVRKNKTLAYSQVSTSDVTSDSDHRSDKNLNRVATSTHEHLNDVNKKCESNSPLHADTSKVDNISKECDNTVDSADYVPFLSDIPKPAFRSLNSDYGINSSSSSSKQSDSPPPLHGYLDPVPKTRGKPPPALSRIHLKNEQDFLIPHELSTVLEVDSPMSVKLKSSRNDTKLDIPDTSNRNNNNIIKNISTNPLFEIKKDHTNNNPDLLDSNVELSSEQLKTIATESSDNSKLQMIDMRQFNEIMLKPFFSIQEYAKQCNVGVLDDCSNLEDNINVKEDQINDELSSLHSEASLPDVISELLKRNIISEPFRFDTGSNTNSATVSSESTISVLALSKTRHGKKKLGVVLQSKENSGETSDTLSISSNPDLENAFKKLGMGWASSTLKKTKERLALSSSSNTSTSSLSQFKVRSFNPDVPALVTDTVSSVLKYSKKPQEHIAVDTSKHAEQQTSLSNSMTVKEFLTNELAKKITFNNKSRNETEEFVSLFETKMPEEMKHSSRMIREDNSIDNSMRSGNRARTSTPVQLFKSMTYHSSSSSNISNGLFSNADDLSSVKVTSNSMKHSTSDKDDLIIPNFSLRMKKGSPENSKSD